MKMTNLTDLYVDQLQDMHSCEKQLTRALPKLAEAASDPELRAAIISHLSETEKQLQRLDQILTRMGQAPGGRVCEAAAGLIAEANDLIKADAEDHVRDAGLIMAAQKVEHYEIASYGCLREYADLLGRADDARSLDQTLDEEKAADHTLNDLATGSINAQAMA